MNRNMRQLIRLAGHDPDLRTALRVSAKDLRQAAIAPIHALAHHLHAVLWRVQEPEVVIHTLHWWREEIHAAGEGRATHPLLVALQPWIREIELPLDYFDELVDARLSLVHQRALETPQDHALHCYRAGSILLLLDGAICGYGARTTHRALTRLGHALEELRILQQLKLDLQHGLFLLPPDEVAAFGLDAAALRQPVLPPEATELFRSIGERVWSILSEAVDEFDPDDRPGLLPVCVHAGLRRHLLELLDEADYPVLQQHVETGPLHRWWLARLLARQCKRNAPRAQTD